MIRLIDVFIGPFQFAIQIEMSPASAVAIVVLTAIGIWLRIAYF